jgi:hypothetical protein
MPIISFEKKESIPDGLQDVAVEKDGKWTVDVAPSAKLAEFRDNNINLAKERDELKNQVETFSSIVGEDPAKFQEELSELRKTKTQVEDGKLKGSDAIEKEVAARVDAVKKGYEEQLQAAGQKLAEAVQVADQFKGLYTNTKLDSVISEAVLHEDSGLNPKAMADILTRARSTFVIEDGKVLPKKDGAVVYGSDGATPMSPLEWAKGLREQAPHLALKSAGGDAGDIDANKARGGLSQEDWNKLSGSEKLKQARASGA